MAKRSRASRSARRPGGQGPNRARKTSGAESSPATAAEAGVTAAEDIGASYSEVEVDEVAAAAIAAATSTQATPATPEPAPGKRSRRRAVRTSKRRTQDDLASHAAAETVWVREDLRRIGVVSVVLIAALAAAYVIFGVMDVLSLY